jgi:hypothetical protein
MEAKKARKITVVILLFLLALCVTQCAPKKQVIKEDEEAALKRRVLEYWSYNIRGEWEKSYLYESPDYKEKVNLLAYVNQNSRFPVKWEGCDILEVWTTGEEGYVTVKTKYRYMIPQTNKAAFEKTVKEKWIKVKKDNQWYRVSPVA